jgi:hypothetical protein
MLGKKTLMKAGIAVLRHSGFALYERLRLGITVKNCFLCCRPSNLTPFELQKFPKYRNTEIPKRPNTGGKASLHCRQSIENVRVNPAGSKKVLDF